MKKIIVTPAGRKRYLELLYANLNKCKDEFDEWVIWVNTTNQEDIEYIQHLEKNNDYITSQHLDELVNTNDRNLGTLFNFYKTCTDENTTYLKLDDDIVYIHKNSIKDLFDFRIKNQDYFLVSGNILNNAIITHLYQINGIIKDLPTVTYDCLDNNGWLNPNFSFLLHNEFFKKYSEKNIEDFFIDDWELKLFERFSINDVSWLGKTFKLFNGEVGPADETWLSEDKPKELNKKNIIFGSGLFCHYAFAPQRLFLDSTNVLEMYKNIK
jgi:hypothetical protein